jgi:hypothetical protein
MNYKRKKSRRQVRDTLATTHRWRGNSSGRFAPGSMTLDPEESRSTPPAPKTRKRFVLQACVLPTAADTIQARWWIRRYSDWATFSRYASQRAAEQAMAYALRTHGSVLHFRVREVG